MVGGGGGGRSGWAGCEEPRGERSTERECRDPKRSTGVGWRGAMEGAGGKFGEAEENLTGSGGSAGRCV